MKKDKKLIWIGVAILVIVLGGFVKLVKLKDGVTDGTILDKLLGK
jgi:hypothetical protein